MGGDDRINYILLKKTLSCASGAATAAEITVGVNTLTMDGSNDCYHAGNFCRVQTANIDAYMLVTSDGTLHDNVGVGGT